MSHEFDTKAENMHVLYTIARSQLYSDEILALLREYGINAMDIHIATGQAERPIRITLPTMLDSFLKIRDFGTGLDAESIKDYVSFGESSKRGDPLQTGQLGIGCKCGFTYGDSFLVNSFMGGQVTTWNAYIDPSNKGKIDALNISPTDEPAGIEVIIPIRPNDIEKCHEKAMRFFSFAKVTPEFINQTDNDVVCFNEFKNAKPLFDGDGWRYMGGSQSYAIMGNIPYPIDPNNFTDIEMSDETKNLLIGGIWLDVKLGEVDFAASRENLKYTPHTKKNLANRMADVTSDLMKQASTSLAGCKTLWEAKQVYRSIFDFGGRLYTLRHLFSKSLKFNGFYASNEEFVATMRNDTEMVCHRYIKPGYGKDTKVKREISYGIKAHADSIVIINDTNMVNGIMNRIVPLIEGPIAAARLTNTPVNKFKTVYVLSFRDDTIKQQWFKEVGFDGPWVSLASVPKEPLSKYYPSGSGIPGVANNKHTSKEFTYNGAGKSRYGSSRSDYWNVADVDLANDAGVYVEIERFHYRLSHTGRIENPAELNNILAELRAAGIPVPAEIYGFKAYSLVEAMKNPKLVPFNQWLNTALEDYLKANPTLAQDYANRHYVASQMLNMHYGLAYMLRWVCKWKTLPAVHPIRDLLVKVEALLDYKDDKLRALETIINRVGYVISEKPVHDIGADYQKLVRRYPMLFKTSQQININQLMQPKWSNDFEEYVALVDCVTP